MRVSMPLTSRRRLLPWSFLFLILAGLVFAWGLQYKLSLYDPPPAHAIPAAKLLSQDERPSGSGENALLKSEAAAAKIAHTVLHFQLYLLFLLMPGACAAAAKNAMRWRPERPQVPSYTGLTAFSFRPPPVLN